MPTFNFSFSKKTFNKRKENKDNKKYEVLSRNIVGVIYISINAIHQVSVNGNFYNIKHECFSCKGKDAVYRIGFDENRPLQYIRIKGEYKELNKLCWLPFAVGCIVQGNIVHNKLLGIDLFDIKKVWLDYDNEDAHNALMFYRNNKDKINEVIRNKKINEIR